MNQARAPGGPAGQPEAAAVVERVARLLAPLGLEPGRGDLYVTAFTHTSYLADHPGGGAASNERLEFLGDAVLELTVSHGLFAKADGAGEGALTRMRSLVVRAPTLAGAAERLQLAACLRLSRGEEATGGRTRPALLADLFEALVGAVYLDLGYQAARTFVAHYLAKELAQVLVAGEQRDHKSRLQEWVQKRHRLGETPLAYAVVREEGPDHAREFTVEVRLFDKTLARGAGPSKQAAEQAAARRALASLLGDGDGQEDPSQR